LPFSCIDPVLGVGTGSGRKRGKTAQALGIRMQTRTSAGLTVLRFGASASALQAERWLEAFTEPVHSQAPVCLGKDIGRMDRGGKIAADPDLPARHSEHGDFGCRGYFREVRLFVISPVVSFHDTAKNLLRDPEPGLEFWIIPIDEDRRCCGKVARSLRNVRKERD